ncbi:hypothetical protein Gbem_2096 [Citrifermentans bemidjiense Bem]|uniref:Uncharacterized protein n=1 Tax=Citrifermentans bemidjiense (strain ATCC BAA-1014 / DSM 16622 / JCM 12645 / Bem) TaxID=404380 RepID=B5ECS4_CITBB|nr:hypothetical protein [Citrifermentans bemidjiense]ACH39109.1 hypothetical protein Gbem_2096 [Citrifermentans bemidjiense Bem]
MFWKKQTDFTQLWSELSLFTRRDVTQGIKLAKYKKAAGSLLKSDPVSGHALMGLVACLEHDLSSMHAQHLKAIELSQSCLPLMYYALSLEKSCLWNECAKYTLLALDLAPQDPKLLNAALRIAPLTGRFSLQKRLLQQWQESHEGVRHPDQGHFDALNGSLAKHGLLEKDLKQVITAVGDAFCESDAILLKHRYELVPLKDGTFFIHYRFLLPDNLVASYYEDLIAAKLDAAACHPRIFDVFSFSVENETMYELYDYMDRELGESADTIKVPDPEQIKLIEELVAGVEV